METKKIIGYLAAWHIEVDQKNWGFDPKKTFFDYKGAPFKNLDTFHPPIMWSHPDPSYTQNGGRKPCYQVELTIKIIKKIDPILEEK